MIIIIVFTLGSDRVIRCRYLLFFRAQVFWKTLFHESTFLIVLVNGTSISASDEELETECY